MNLSESYKNRLKELAGLPLLVEATDVERNAAFAASNKRIPYNKDLMIQAIKEGREVGVLFQSNNSKYKMPVAKYRTVYPVALGISRAGNQVIRAFHKIGQSESEALRTGRRSAEVENAWRLMKVSNIKSMWLTGVFFYGPLEAYNRADQSMLNVEVSADFNAIKKFQKAFVEKAKSGEEAKKKSSMIKKVGFPEKPLDKTRSGQQPVQPIQKQKTTPVNPAIKKPLSGKGNKG